MPHMQLNILKVLHANPYECIDLDAREVHPLTMRLMFCEDTTLPSKGTYHKQLIFHQVPSDYSSPVKSPLHWHQRQLGTLWEHRPWMLPICFL